MGTLSTFACGLKRAVLLWGILSATSFARAPTLEFSQLRSELSRMSSEQQAAFMKSLPSGTKLRFGNGKVFTLGSFLGAGGSTAVYEISPAGTDVLRLPLYNVDPSMDYLDYQKQFLDGDAVLEKYGVPKVKVLDHHGSEYIVASRLPSDVQNTDAIAKLGENNQRRALGALKDFARRSAAFDDIGDFRLDQLHYSWENNSLVLGDWAHQTSEDADEYHRLFNPQIPEDPKPNKLLGRYLELLGLQKTTEGYQTTIGGNRTFSHLSFEERVAFAQELEREILEERRRLSQSQDFFRDSQKYGIKAGHRPANIVGRPNPSLPAGTTSPCDRVLSSVAGAIR
jgi:hypothetical protein